MAIVVGFVDSPLGEAALEGAVREAEAHGDSILLVSQVASPRNEEDSRTYGRRRAELEETLRRHAERVRARGVGCDAHVSPVPLDPAQAVLAAADEFDANLIVVGIRRRSPVGKALLGSTAQEIILGADCPVLGVKSADSREAG